MPELPDVEVFKRYFDSKALEKPLEEAEVKSESVLGNVEPGELESSLRGGRFETSSRHGKHLFVREAGGRWLAFHFGMTGFFNYTESAGMPDEHPRVIFHFPNGARLIYDCQRKLGEINLVADPEESKEEKGLGPDALKEVDRVTFREILSGSRAMAKSTLMDQGKIAGLGNVYSDEALFQAGIHPRVKARELPTEEVDRLHGETIRVLDTAIDREVDPDELPPNFLLPRRDPGSACPECGEEIRRIEVSGRGTYFCPRCQPKESITPH